MTNTEWTGQARPVGPVSEVLYHFENPDYPRIGIVYLLLKGRPDEGAMTEAVNRFRKKHPEMASRLAFDGEGRYKRLMRAPVEPVPLQFVNDFAEDLGGKSYIEVLAEYFKPIVENGFDLFAEPPWRCYLFRFPDDVCALVSIGSHIGADGANMLESGKDVMAFYHELVEGRPAEWAQQAAMPSSTGRPHGYNFRAILKRMREDKKLGKEYQVATIARNKWPLKPRRYLLQTILTKDETVQAKARAKSLGLSFNDLFLVEFSKAVDRYLDYPVALHRAGMVVNTRTRMKGHRALANHASAISIILPPEARKNEDTLVREFAAQRKQRLDIGQDVFNIVMLKHIMRAMRLLPFDKRKGVFKKLMSGRTRSFGCSSLGIIWPEIRDGKLTGGTFLKESGGLEVLGVNGFLSVPWGIGQTMVSHTFDGRFHYTTSAYEQTYPRETMAWFFEQIKNGMLE